MARIKTNELTGPSLDWAVCEAAGMFAAYPKLGEGKKFLAVHRGNSAKYVHPSTDWSQGGPIVEREQLWLAGPHKDRKDWYADSMDFTRCHGPAPLIAAMRCYVASKLGDEIDIPDELINKGA